MRFGSFEIFKDADSYSGAEGPSNGLKEEMLPPMLDYLLAHFFKQVKQEDKTESYKQLFTKVVEDTAELVALWQCVGFCHGVLNTDNMSVHGLTMDFGPYAFMEHFDPDFICNHSDMDRGRYRYKAQPGSCEWNLLKLSEALHPLVDQSFSKAHVVDNFKTLYKGFYYTKMGQKLGFLITSPPTAEQVRENCGTRQPLIGREDFRELTTQEVDCVDLLFETMAKTGADFTDTFRLVGLVQVCNE
jgi:uncharacterized protein YdiU (UPF0061 family)